MKIEMLGTAQDGGCPHAGCYCDNCLAVYEGKESEKYPVSLGITSNGFRLLVEATPKMDIQLYNWKMLSKSESYLPDATIITHAHIGHYTGLMYLGKEVLNTKGHKVYVSVKIAKFLKSNSPWSDLVEGGNIELIILPIGEKVVINDDLKVEAIKVPHRNEHADTVGLIISDEEKAIFFLPDIDSWDGFIDELNSILARVDIAYLDATFYSHEELGDIRGRDLKKVPHPTVLETERLIEEGVIKVGDCEIILTHFNHTNRLVHKK